MRERLITFGLAAAALYLFYSIWVNQSHGSHEPPSRPTSEDSGGDGELALWRWLRTEQVPTSSLRYRYDHLWPRADGASPTGNVLITVLPFEVPMHADEPGQLRRWVDAGNTLLILAALDDTPAWSLASDPRTLLRDLRELSGLRFKTLPAPAAPAASPQRKRSASDELADMLKAREVMLDAVGEHPLLAAVHTVHASSAYLSSQWTTASDIGSSLILLRRHDTGQPALWLLRQGEGQVIVSSMASLIGNSVVGRDDNARLLANIVRWSRTGQGQVIFDDAHQGLSNYFDAKAFYADPRLHRTLGWLLLLWLAFVLGPLPLRSACTLWKPLDETVLVEASGRFYSVAVPAPAAANRLFENFFNRLRRRLNLPQNGAPLWDWLQSQTRLTADERRRLQDLYRRVRQGERVKLAPLQTLLSDVEGRMA